MNGNINTTVDDIVSLLRGQIPQIELPAPANIISILTANNGGLLLTRQRNSEDNNHVINHIFIEENAVIIFINTDNNIRNMIRQLQDQSDTERCRRVNTIDNDNHLNFIDMNCPLAH